MLNTSPHPEIKSHLIHTLIAYGATSVYDVLLPTNIMINLPSLFKQVSPSGGAQSQWNVSCGQLLPRLIALQYNIKL